MCNVYGNVKRNESFMNRNTFITMKEQQRLNQRIGYTEILLNIK